LRKDGIAVHVAVTLSPIFDVQGDFIAISAIARDITERKKIEEAIANNELARKKEIHHRIKNNLQVISSLLDLQADRFRNKMEVMSSEVMIAFRESQDRVASMALIHEELYKNGNVEDLHFSPYVTNLTKHLLETYNVKGVNIGLDMDVVDDAYFNMDTAVPLGIIINELVSNAFKYAFKGRINGEIRIKLSRNGSNGAGTTFVLMVSDNGIGIPENLNIEDLDSLGMQLVTSLVDQLDGTLDLHRNEGTEFTMQFPINEKNGEN
jgi:two-component sensor histidine kinase